MRPKNKMGIRDVKVSIQLTVIIFEVFMFSVVTFRNASFTTDPIRGERTPFEKLIVPVKKAKTVPSIFLGMTLANSTIIGKSKNAINKAPMKKF
jgi:hypothetical protein